MGIKEFVKKLSSERWNIGFIDNNMDSIMNGDAISVRWMKHSYKDRWFADPFILDVTEKHIIVLVEEYYKPIGRGRISRLLIDRETMILKSLDIILELETHLSFPCIMRDGNNIYIYPENCESGSLSLYKYDDDKKKCEKMIVMSENALADSVELRINSDKYLFTTSAENPNGNQLRIYSYNNIYSNYSVIEFKENIARMAGDFFNYRGKLYRPAQECNYQYGHAVSLQEVSYDNNKWSFQERRRLYSVHPKLNIGMHTFNVYNDMIVVDALGFDRIWIRKFLKFLHIKK